jgi:hypothetical protein
VQGVKVPVHGVAPGDQLQPGVVHVDWVSWPQEEIVPVQVPDNQEHP